MKNDKEKFKTQWKMKNDKAKFKTQWKMKNDKEKFKKEFKARIYRFILKLVKLIDKLPKDSSSQIFAQQLLRRKENSF